MQVFDFNRPPGVKMSLHANKALPPTPLSPANLSPPARLALRPMLQDATKTHHSNLMRRVQTLESERAAREEVIRDLRQENQKLVSECRHQLQTIRKIAEWSGFVFHELLSFEEKMTQNAKQTSRDEFGSGQFDRHWMNVVVRGMEANV